MQTLLTLHLVNFQPLALFIAFLALLLLIVSWMFVIKSSRYKELQEDYESSKHEFQRTLAELRLEYSIDVKKLKVKHITEIGTIKAEHEEEYAKRKIITDMWEKLYHDLKASLPKPRERAHDGKFAKGSYRLDNLRKHLMAGNRADKFTAQESFNIGDITKYIAKLKAEGFVVRKQKRRIAEDSFLTEYWIEAKKEAREWKAIEQGHDLRQSTIQAKHHLIHGLTVVNPSKEDAKAILTAAGERGLLCSHGHNDIDSLYRNIWYNGQGQYVGVTSCAITNHKGRTFVTAAEFIARMQPKQTNA